MDNNTIDLYGDPEEVAFIGYVATESVIRCDPSDYGLPSEKKYPMPDKEHVKHAIRFFNYVEDDNKMKELAKNINRKIDEFGMRAEVNVGDNNKFKKFFKGEEKPSEDAVMTGYSPIVPPINPTLKKINDNPLNMHFATKR